jgi:hypothetical protein
LTAATAGRLDQFVAAQVTPCTGTFSTRWRSQRQAFKLTRWSEDVASLIEQLRLKIDES